MVLHLIHPGESRMKALARSYCYWPNIDDAVVNYVKLCTICQATQPKCQTTQFHWPHTTRVFERVHVDYLKFDQTNVLVLHFRFHSHLF